MTRTAGVLLALLLTAGCTGAAPDRAPGDRRPADTGPLQVAAIWTGVEQDSFSAVLDAFTRDTGVPTELLSTGDDVGSRLDALVQAGSPPDVAVLPQVGLLRGLAVRRLLTPLSDHAAAAADEHQAPFWNDLGQIGGQRYGVVHKVANKSVWWYSPQALQSPPTTWQDALAAARRTDGSGKAFLAVGGGDGWPLTDLFENLYLSGAGPEAYDRLARHDLAWTHPTVRTALAQLKALAQVPGALAGGPDGVLTLDFPLSVQAVFGPSPQAATVFEGDFVVSALRAVRPDAVAGRDYDFFPFPATRAGAPAVVAGADLAVAMTDDPRAQQLLAFLAAPEAAQVWAPRGGFLSPVRDLPPQTYPDDLTRRLAAQLAAAQNAGRLRFDLSDLPPTTFGATPGSGLYLHLQQLVTGASVEQVAQALETAATEAFRTF